VKRSVRIYRSSRKILITYLIHFPLSFESVQILTFETQFLFIKFIDENYNLLSLELVYFNLRAISTGQLFFTFRYFFSDKFKMGEDMRDEQLERVYAWVDGIALSRPKKNITRDFSDAGLYRLFFLIENRREKKCCLYYSQYIKN